MNRVVIRTLDGDLSRFEGESLGVHDMAIVCDNAGHNGHTGLDSKVESTLLERQQHGLLGVTSSTLGEHVDTLSLGLNLTSSALHSLAGILAVLAIDENGTAQRHEPAEERHLLQRSLSSNTAVLGKHDSEHENIEFCLVVSDKDSRARSTEDIIGVLNDELNASGVAHNVVKTAADSPLRDLLLPDDGEEDGGEDSVGCDGEERDVGSETAGGEGGFWNDEGHGVEEDCEGGVAEEEVEEDIGDGHDGRRQILLSLVEEEGGRGGKTGDETK